MIIYPTSHPEQIIDQQIVAFLNSPQTESCFAVHYNFSQYYLPGKPCIELIGVIALLKKSFSDYSIFVSVVPVSSESTHQLEAMPPTYQSALDFTNANNVPLCNLSEPLLLESVHIPKPWGKEIWFTGIEERGQSAVQQDQKLLSLPWLLSLAPTRLLSGDHKELILLKVLAPLADEVHGDLYFEMHEEKQEVYIVTHIDSDAWPDNIGKIRLGFNAHKHAEFANDDKFKLAYLDAVKNYENIRRKIDALFDQKRVENHIDLRSPVDAALAKIWEEDLSAELVQQEQYYRNEMDNFTALKSLKIGDVVKVPCFVPHALQHGVQVIEFQTPVYERKILSFAQKVLTQEHWDTQEALTKVQTNTPLQTDLTRLSETDDQLEEQVAVFNDFEVRRVTLKKGAEFTLKKNSRYTLMMIIAGSLLPNEKICPNAPVYTSQQAVFIPCGNKTKWLAGDEGATLLLAFPLTE